MVGIINSLAKSDLVQTPDLISYSILDFGSFKWKWGIFYGLCSKGINSNTRLNKWLFPNRKFTSSNFLNVIYSLWFNRSTLIGSWVLFLKWESESIFFMVCFRSIVPKNIHIMRILNLPPTPLFSYYFANHNGGILFIVPSNAME